MTHSCQERDDLHRALADWVSYLRDVGVRELKIESPPSRQPSQGPAERAGSSESPPEREAPPTPVSAGAGLFHIPSAADASHDPATRLREIRERLGDCTRCKLHAGRTNIVFGVGSPRARLMFVGEGPGADEDAQGEPFVGRAGRKLNEMIEAIGLRREETYIANIVKCRPPGNRDPEPEEVATCSPFLFEQIGAVRPLAIVALGSPAARTLLGTKRGITELRGQWGSFLGIPVMPTFHPAYLLRAYTIENRRRVWEDLRAARTRLDQDP
jgi:DNA polymerase